MTPRSILEGRHQDALVEIGGWAGHRERTEQAQDARAATDLRRAGRAAAHMGGEAGGFARVELIEEERVNEVSGARAVQGVRRCHVLYMTTTHEKVARRFRAGPVVGAQISASGPTPR